MQRDNMLPCTCDMTGEEKCCYECEERGRCQHACPVTPDSAMCAETFRRR